MKYVEASFIYILMFQKVHQFEAMNPLSQYLVILQYFYFKYRGNGIYQYLYCNIFILNTVVMVFTNTAHPYLKVSKFKLYTIHTFTLRPATMAMMYGRHSLWWLPTHNILAYLGATGNCDIVLPSGVRVVTLLPAV